jgi:hypothetical protein
MKAAFSFVILLISSFAIGQNLNQYVNPFIGTGGHGHTFPGATLPFGMVQLSGTAVLATIIRMKLFTVFRTRI